ncbi:MAG: bifunctional enzyme conserved domain protein [Labilithrix sp.]|nr:bifunctional enzyme conserved domain protein [Labilithrix sp.]
MDPIADVTRDVTLMEADLDGVFPEGFYATTNFPTDVRLDGAWVEVRRPEMDVGVRVVRMSEGVRAEACPMHRVRRGDLLVVGDHGVRVRLPVRSEAEGEAFRFMSSGVSTERPKARLIRDVAIAMKNAHASGKKVLLVGGPAIVHSGSAPLLATLIRDGWIDVLFAGNALAAHDIEASMFGTSLGIELARGQNVPHGHQHHLRAINRVRRVGSIAAAVRDGLVTSGVMHACVTKPIPFVLCGSIRDDGPLPDVITDAVAAADAMRGQVENVGVAIVVATTLHGVATGNMLPASVFTFSVDTSADSVIKLVDRGTHQAVGIVTDCEYFLSELGRALKEPERG